MSWMRQYKLAEYLSGHFPNLKAAERWIYFAVIRGDIRAQFRNGEILGPAWLKRISQGRWSGDPDDVFGLPSDIGLSMDDAVRCLTAPESRPTVNVVSLKKGAVIPRGA